MSRPSIILLALFGALIASAVGLLQTAPGYMDADYYYAGGLRLSDRYGFSELILWNYLDDPAGLPHPSHGYWMPLVSILAAVGMLAPGLDALSAARLPFYLLAAAIPPLTAALAFRLSDKSRILDRRRAGWFAGILSIFPAFYLPYLGTTDSFAVYMVCGALFFLLAPSAMGAPVGVDARLMDGKEGRRGVFGGGAMRSRWAVLGLGVLAGLMHLARADGLLWLGMALLAIWIGAAGRPGRIDIGLQGDVTPGSQQARNGMTHPGWLDIIGAMTFCLMGYLLVMGPWMARNLAVFGAPLATGAGRALWITSYDELFIYPASILTPERWLESGWANILQARAWATGQNLQSALAVQGSIFLTPLVLAGMWRLRRDVRVQLGAIAWLVTFLAMTVIFPYQGARGGFFHSGAALQPLWWALAPVGLNMFLEWGARRRDWNLPQARRVFQTGLLGIAAILALALAATRIIGDDPAQPVWEQSFERYQAVERALQEWGAFAGQMIMVNNAPGYFVVAGRPAISIPMGDLQTALTVADRYGARYLALEMAQLQGSDDPYTNPGSRRGLRYLGEVQGVQVYETIACNDCSR